MIRDSRLAPNTNPPGCYQRLEFYIQVLRVLCPKLYRRCNTWVVSFASLLLRAIAEGRLVTRVPRRLRRHAYRSTALWANRAGHLTRTLQSKPSRLDPRTVPGSGLWAPIFITRRFRGFGCCGWVEIEQFFALNPKPQTTQTPTPKP